MGRPQGAKNRKRIEAEAAETFRLIRFAPLEEKDPIKYLEARRLEMVQRLELIADEARENGMPELELKAVAFGLRLTSVFKSRVDVTASNLGLVKAPSLDGLNTEELKRIEQASDEAVAELAETIIKEQ